MWFYCPGSAFEQCGATSLQKIIVQRAFSNSNIFLQGYILMKWKWLGTDVGEENENEGAEKNQTSFLASYVR